MSHIHEKIDFTFDVFVVHKGKVLLRMHDKYKILLSIGGHIELDEDPVQAALREVKEEVGLDITLWSGNMGPVKSDARSTILLPPISMNRHFVSDTHEHISLVYFATTAHDDVRPAPGEQQDGWKWYSKEELDATEMPENIRAYAKFALDTVKE